MIFVCSAPVMTCQAVESARRAVGMTEVTGNIVRPLKRERVSEGCRFPGRGVVALLAVCREVQGHMIGTARVVVGVAGETVRRDRSEVPSGMTVRAVKGGMCTSEREEVMHEIRPGPAGGSVASFTICGPAVGRMVGRPGTGQIPLMAELALQRSSAVLADGRLEVTALTGSYGVCGDKMETRASMLGYETYRRPVRLSVTSLTIQSQR